MTYIGRTARVFLSYSEKDRHLAARIKTGLENFGLEVFLAHEDINPSADWEKTILENLDSTDIFIPVITGNFKNSQWTDQECGIAYSKKKLIISIAVDGVIPYGFISKYQALKLDSKNTKDQTSKLIEAIIKAKPEFESQLLDSLVKAFAVSYSFDDAGLKSKLILSFSKINTEQINEIFKQVFRNDQIYRSCSARSNIKKLFENYKEDIQEDLKKEIMKRLGEDLEQYPNLIELFRDSAYESISSQK